MFSYSIFKRSSTSTSSSFRNLINLANHSSKNDNKNNRISFNNQLVTTTAKSAVSSENENSSSKNIQLLWPKKIVLTGSVILADAKYQQQFGTNVLNPGDVRIRSKYFISANDDDDGAEKKKISKMGSSSKMFIDNKNSEIFADSGPSSSTSAFVLEAKTRSRGINGGKLKQNKFHQQANPHFKSVDEFGLKFHQLDGHEYVYMQNISQNKFHEAPVGCVLIDVWVIPEIYHQHDDVNHSEGFWAKLCGANEVVGVLDSTFKSGDGELVMEGKFYDFLKRCKGVSVYYNNDNRGVNDNKRAVVDPNKVFRGYFFNLEKPKGTSLSFSLDRTWMSKRSLKK